MTDSPLPGRKYSDAVYAFAAQELQNSESSLHVQSMLVARGLDEESAADVVSQLCAAHAHETDTARENSMAIGACLCIGGVLVTAATAIAATGPGGGVVVVMSGAIVFGAIHFVRALWREES